MNVSPRQTLRAKEKPMSTFTIDAENTITAYPSTDEPSKDNATDLIRFDSQATLAKVSAEWPMSRLVDIWNSIAGQSPVKKFQDHNKAVTRIWKAIQPLAGHGQASAPEPETGNPKGGPKKATAAAKPVKKAKADNKPKDVHSNKKAEVIELMKRAKGAALAEIMELTGWQKHTIRSFVSILGSKGGETIESSKNAAGERTYKIAK